MPTQARSDSRNRRRNRPVLDAEILLPEDWDTDNPIKARENIWALWHEVENLRKDLKFAIKERIRLVSELKDELDMCKKDNGRLRRTLRKRGIHA